MALTIKNNGEAVVEEAKTTAQPVQTTAQVQNAADTGNSETTGQSTRPAMSTQTQSGTSTAEKSTTGLDYATVQQGLNTTYEGKWDEQIADLYNQIVGRESFKYSTEDDMLYKMYEQKYTQQGKQAMKDTMGQTSALTGGYGNSYGQIAGQQTYDAYLQELNNLIPDLFDRAYQQYAAEGDRLTQQYGLLTDMDSRDYNRFTTQYGMNVDAYNRLMNEAALKGAAGDFSGYEDIFGADSAGKMETAYNLDRLLPYLESGLISSEQFNQILGPFLESMGIVTPEAVTGTAAEENGRSMSDILRDQVWERANFNISQGGDEAIERALAQEIIAGYRS